MNSAEVLEICRQTLLTLLLIGSPIILVALIVGLAVSLVQALTQIQEMTLSFVPKIICVFLAIIVFMPFMLAHLIQFTQEIFDKMTVGFGG